MAATRCLALALTAAVAYGHAVLVQPPARNGMANGIGIKLVGENQYRNTPDTGITPTGGCGGQNTGNPGAGTPVVTYEPGQQVTVQWKNTLPHPSAPGVRIAIQYSPTDSFGANILASGVEVKQVKDAIESYVITLDPTKTCEQCVLQWSWVSTADGGAYVGCSDIRISRGTGGIVAPVGSLDSKVVTDMLKHCAPVYAGQKRALPPAVQTTTTPGFVNNDGQILTPPPPVRGDKNLALTLGWQYELTSKASCESVQGTWATEAGFGRDCSGCCLGEYATYNGYTSCDKYKDTTTCGLLGCGNMLCAGRSMCDPREREVSNGADTATFGFAAGLLLFAALG